MPAPFVVPALYGASVISRTLPIASYLGFNALGEGLSAADEKREFNPYNLVDPTGFLFPDGKGLLQQGVENAPDLFNEFIFGVPSDAEIKKAREIREKKGAPLPPKLPPKPPLQSAPPIPGADMGNMGAIYQQGRSAAKSQEDMNRVRDLGLALHAQQYGTPGQRMASTIGARNPLLDSMGLQQPSRPEVFVENPTDAYLQSEVDKKGKEVQDFLKTFNASRSTK